MRFVIASGLMLFAGSLQAKEAHCMARMIMDAPAAEAPEEVRSKGNGDFGPIMQIKVNKKTGQMTYCAANSYCYVANAFELITPCRIKRDITESTDTFFSFFTR